MSNIMILEDDPIQLKNLEKIVKDINPEISVFTAGSYPEAVKLLEEHPTFQLFMLDIDLGKNKENKDGLDFAHHVRAMSEYEFIPLIYITSISERMSEALSGTHCYDYIIKPYKEEKIKALIEKMLKMPEPEPSVLDIPGLNGARLHVLTRDIVYIEACLREIIVHTAQNDYHSKSTSLRYIKKILPDHFVQCHRGYIVNTYFSISYDRVRDEISIAGIDKKLPVGRKYRDKLGL